jgi:hypothetical protein
VAGSLVATGIFLPAAFGQDAEREDLGELQRALSAEWLPQAKAELTFDMWLPEWLPEGYELQYIAWFLPEEDVDITASTVDVWFAAPGLPFIHIWQTDMPPAEFAAKDPVARGGLPVAVEGEHEFLAEEGLAGFDSRSVVQLSARLPNGITLSIDSGLPKDDVVRIAHSLEPADSD